MIAGNGPDRPRLEDIAKDMAVEVDWLGAVPNERVFCLLNEADVFALPCREDSRGDRDGIPVVLMEAMASGVPVVSGDLPAIRELVEDGKNGMLVEGNNPVLLADKLAMLLGNKELRHSLAAEGRKKIDSEFSLELNLDRLEKLFAEVMA
jgi:glycosyltransferase involved in cell wall biosynthesis